MSRFSTRSVSSSIVYDVVFKKNNLTESFNSYLKLFTDIQHQSSSKAFCFETLRHYHFLQSLWLKFTKKKPKDKMVQVIMTVAMAEYKILNKADYIVVNEAINTAKILKKNWARGLINSCLRQAIKETSSDFQNDAEKYSHPQWWIEVLKKDWPEQWQEILIANNTKPPLWIRKNIH